MNPEAPLLSAPELTAPVEEPSLFTHQRDQSSFSKTGAEASEKSPLMWEFRTALIGMFCTIPVFLFLLFIGDISVLGFSFPLMFIGLFTGLAFRKCSRPWALPMTSLMTAIFTMFIAELLIVIVVGSAWTNLSPFLYAVTMLTINPFDLLLDAMTHALEGARGYVAGCGFAFWLACND